MSESSRMQSEMLFYNSRILKNYIKYLKRYYSGLDIDRILDECRISRHEVENASHWFTQRQMNHFHHIIDQTTDDPDLARNVGRYYFSAENLGSSRHFGLGLLSIATGFRLMGEAYTMISRSMRFSIESIGKNHIHLIFTPKPGVNEEPFQCKNRIGAIEAMAELLNDRFPRLAHPLCIHKGDPVCQYDISWKSATIEQWKRIRALSLPFFLVAAAAVFPMLPLSLWLPAALTCGLIPALLSLAIARKENRQDQEKMLSQGKASELLIDEINARYKNTLLIRNIGKAMGTIDTEGGIVKTAVDTMKTHLDFDRGLIMLADTAGQQLVYRGSYGYATGVMPGQGIEDIAFNLDNSDASGFFVRAFKEQQSCLLKNVDECLDSFSSRSRRLIEKAGIQQLVCAPVVFNGRSLGIIAVDNVRSRRSLTRSDEHLICGIASQIAISIVNARAYDKILESEKRYRLFAENAGDAIWLMDIKTRQCTYMSPAIKTILGFRAEEVLDHYLENIVTEESRHALHSTFCRELKKAKAGEPYQSSHILMVEQRHKLGHNVWTEVTTQIITDEHGTPRSVLGITRDMSDRERALEEKRKLEEDIQIAQRLEAIGTFAGGIAHDFNNILSAILLNAEIGLESSDAVDKNDAFDQILTSSKRAGELVRQLLVFTKGQSATHRPVCIGTIVTETLKIIKSMVPTTITIQKSLPDTEWMINADAAQIQQVIMNLCANAAQAMNGQKNGTLYVGLTSDDSSALAADGSDFTTDAGVALVVRDTGCGIPPEYINRIFDPFFSTKERTSGTGLGLSIVHGIVSKHNGAIHVDSEAGRGTTFRVVLPRLSQKDIQRQTSDGRDSLANLRGNESVLLVDDERALLSVGKQLLERLGYTVTATASSRKALDEFKRRADSFDIVITDMRMPEMTGLELSEKILDVRNDIPMLICSGLNELPTTGKARHLGVNYIAKPYEMNEIALVIRQSLGKAPHRKRTLH
ncbi:MAG: ATP-binding protein [Thermodesulfobacteriota bacterium]|nr:ATP-binding protein [Thermodesulfobacteriota bacterium]